MHWPKIQTERLRFFRPRFCPWSDCPQHRRKLPGYSFTRHGGYGTYRRSRVPRFRCGACKRTFSRQSFAVSYYLKRPELLIPIAAGLQAGSAHRQLARTLGCAPSTVTRLSARLGRHALLLSAHALRHLEGRLAETVVLDHFESFEFSQDYPFGVATAVGRESWFLYGIDPAPHSRSGKRSSAQKARLLQRPRRRLHGGYEGSSRRTLELLLRLIPEMGRLDLATDGHSAYGRAASFFADRIRLERFPNPRRAPKGSARTPEMLARDRAMFPTDQLHALLRHSLAHHRRETIAFGRRINALAERLFLAMIWRNFVKWRSERRPDRSTPAMWVGLTAERWNWRRVFARRLFPGRERLPAVWRELYDRTWITPVLPFNTRHRLIHAY